MSDDRELPNMTATEIANAKHPDAPGNALLSALIDRELKALVTAGFVDQRDVDALDQPPIP